MSCGALRSRCTIGILFDFDRVKLGFCMKIDVRRNRCEPSYVNSHVPQKQYLDLKVSKQNTKCSTFNVK